MKKILSIILSLSLLFSQATYEFTEEEVMELYNSIQELEQSDSLNIQIIDNLEEQLKLYEQQIENDSLMFDQYKYQLELKDEIIDEISPKWYEHRYLWFISGAITILASSWVVGNVTK